MPYHEPAPGPAPFPEPYRKGPWIFFPDNAEYYPAMFRADDVVGIEVERVVEERVDDDDDDDDDDREDNERSYVRIRVALRSNDEVYYGPVVWFPIVVELLCGDSKAP
jgi:hypothetical protein